MLTSSLLHSFFQHFKTIIIYKCFIFGIFYVMTNIFFVHPSKIALKRKIVVKLLFKPIQNIENIRMFIGYFHSLIYMFSLLFFN